MKGFSVNAECNAAGKLGSAGPNRPMPGWRAPGARVAPGVGSPISLSGRTARRTARWVRRRETRTSRSSRIRITTPVVAHAPGVLTPTHPLRPARAGAPGSAR